MISINKAKSGEMGFSILGYSILRCNANETHFIKDTRQQVP